MKTNIRLIILIITTVLVACNSDEKIKGFKSNEILVVTLDIEDETKVEKATLKSSYSEFVDSIIMQKDSDLKTIKLKCPQKGEGTYSICIYTKNDTLCSNGGYIEGGYRPRIKLKNRKFTTEEWF
jgi:hypothetical protein